MTFEAAVKYLSELNAASIFLRLFLSVIFSGIIGFEREKKRRAAGFRTHMLVCVGAALAMLTDQFIFENVGGNTPTRIAAQVVSGIGFLGAGTIIVTGRQQVKGLTTAAGLWASACMGIALGIGFYSGAIAGFIFILLITIILQKVDDSLVRSLLPIDMYIELDGIASLKGLIIFCKGKGIRLNYQSINELKTGEAKLGILATLEADKYPDRKGLAAEIGLLPGVSFAEELN